MGIFKVWVDSCDYDEFDAYVVAANSKEEVIKESGKEIYLPLCNVNGAKQELHIKEIGTTDKYDKFTVILASFNAG